MADGDHAELDRLVRQSEGGRQYHELLMAGAPAEAGKEAVAKQARTPDQVPPAEVAHWRERVRSLLKARDRKAMEAARR